MKNRNFIFAVLCIVLASSLILVSGVFAIAEMPVDEKTYTIDGFESITPDTAPTSGTDSDITETPSDESVSFVPQFEDTPLTQAQLKEIFSPYVHEENQGKTAVIFSDEQAKQLISVREQGKRNPLKYEEVLYLINDSVSLYSRYDEIIIQSSMVDRIGLTDYLGGNSGIIKTSDAESDYAKTVRDIYSIIIYRLYLHDSGFIAMTTGNESYWNNGNLISDFHCLFEGDELLESENFFEAKRIFLLAIDGGTQIGASYNQSLKSAYYTHCDSWTGSFTAMFGTAKDDGVRLNSQLLIIDLPLDNAYKFVNQYSIEIAQKEAYIRDTLFPANEVTALKPDGYFDRIFSFPLKDSVELALDFSLKNTDYDVILTESETAQLIDILDSERAWTRGIHTDENMRYRFKVEEMGINYCCGAFFNSDQGNYLILTEEEKSVIDSIIEKYTTE